MSAVGRHIHNARATLLRLLALTHDDYRAVGQSLLAQTIETAVADLEAAFNEEHATPEPAPALTFRTPRTEAIEILEKLSTWAAENGQHLHGLDDAIGKLQLPGKLSAPHCTEWLDGWPRGTWLISFDLIFEAGFTARDSEGSLMYLVPASYFGLEAAPTRWMTIYAGTVNEARTADGQIYTRRI